MQTLLSSFDKRSPKFIWRLSVSMVLCLTFFSSFAGTNSPHELLYIFPITVASWYGSKKSGLLLAALATVSLVLVRARFESFSLLSLGLASVIDLVSFSILAVMVTNFRSVHRLESTAAGTDSLTKIANARSFYLEFANELVRSSRYDHKFTLAYLDIDNFKIINDSRGHAEGDKLLIAVANCLKHSLRATDITARVGGDEFVCLLPETDQKEAEKALSGAIESLTSCMEKQAWRVTFSVGAVTFKTPPEDIKEAMSVADKLMYSVKNTEKNNIYYENWPKNIPRHESNSH